MTSFDINVSNLKSLCTDFDKGYSNYLSNLGNVYQEIRKSKDMWFDNTVDGFINLALEDKTKIDEYNESMQTLRAAIGDFADGLSSVARQCGVGSVNNIKYNSNRVNELIGSLSSAENNLRNINNILTNMKWTLPASFAYTYRQAINNIINSSSRNGDNLGDIRSLFNNVSRQFENSIANLRNRCSSGLIQPLNLQPVEYYGGVVSTTFGGLNITDEALSNQNLVAEITGVSYTEENPNIVNGQSSLYGINDNNVNYTEENPNIINGQSSLYGLNDNNVVYKEEKPNIVNGQSSLFTAKAELDEAPLDVNMGGKSDSVSVDNNGLNMSDINVSSFINDNAESVNVSQGAMENGNNMSNFNFDSAETVDVNNSGIEMSTPDMSSFISDNAESVNVSQGAMENGNNMSNFNFDSAKAVDVNEIKANAAQNNFMNNGENM